jgi:hypothetical protein
MKAMRQSAKRRDCPLRGDRLRAEIRALQERMALLDRLIAEAMRSHK